MLLEGDLLGASSKGILIFDFAKLNSEGIGAHIVSLILHFFTK